MTSNTDKALYGVLIVTSTEKSCSFLCEMLDPEIFGPITIAKSAGEARRVKISGSFDIVIVNTPLPDEFGYEFALSAAESPESCVVLLVKNEVFDEISYRVEDFGVLTVSKPISKPFFNQIMKITTATRERLRRLEKENRRLQSKLDEMKITERAKWALVHYLNMTEADAHRYIEKQAMDMRSTKKAVAEDIIKTYENR